MKIDKPGVYTVSMLLLSPSLLSAAMKVAGCGLRLKSVLWYAVWAKWGVTLPATLATFFLLFTSAVDRGALW